MWTIKDIHEYLIHLFVIYGIRSELNDVSQKMYFIALHYIDRGEY